MSPATARRFCEAACLAAGLSLGLPPAALALSLGDAEALSRLGQPLRARIAFQLGQGESLEPSCVRARAARPESGSEIPTLPSIRARIERGAGGNYVYVESTESASEPVLLLTLDVQCDSGGRLRRSYTLLQDPPDVSTSYTGPVEESRAPEEVPRFPAAARLPEPAPATAAPPKLAPIAPPAVSPMPGETAPRPAPGRTAKPPAAAAAGEAPAATPGSSTAPASPPPPARRRAAKAPRDVLRLSAPGEGDLLPEPRLKLAYELAEREGVTEAQRERLRREFAERMSDDNVYQKVLALGDEIAGLKLQITQMQDKERSDAEARRKTEAAERDRRNSFLTYGALLLLALVVGAWIWMRRPRQDRFGLSSLPEVAGVAGVAGVDLPVAPARERPAADAAAAPAHTAATVPATSAPKAAPVEAPAVAADTSPASEPTVRLDAPLHLEPPPPVAPSAPPAAAPHDKTPALTATQARPAAKSPEHLRLEEALRAHQAQPQDADAPPLRIDIPFRQEAAPDAAGHARAGQSVIDFDLDASHADSARLNPDTADFDLPATPNEPHNDNGIDFELVPAADSATRVDMELDAGPVQALDFKLDPDPAPVVASPAAPDLGFSLELPAPAPSPGAAKDEPWQIIPSPAADAPPAPAPLIAAAGETVDAAQAAQRALRYRNDYVAERFPEVAAGSIELDKPATVIEGARLIYQEDMDVSRAIGLLQVAWAMHPHDSLLLALLEIYWLEGLRAEYADLAQQFLESFSRSHRQWPMIAKLGHAMDPDNPVFSLEGLPEAHEAAPNWLNTQLDMMAHVLARELRGQVAPGDEAGGDQNGTRG